MADRCTLHRLPVERLEDAAADPALAALFREGWKVQASIVVDAGDGRGPSLHLLLSPPSPSQVTPPGSVGSAAVPAGAWALAGVVLGALGALYAAGGL